MSTNIVAANKVAATSRCAHGAATVTTSATLVRSANAGRVCLTLINYGSVTIFWGKDSSVTVSSGIPILAGQSVEDREYTGDVYCIASSGSVNVRYKEDGGEV